MKTMMKTYIMYAVLCTLAVVISGYAGATYRVENDTVVWDDSCNKMQETALRNAVDPAMADQQEWHLNSARAYAELSQMGASCQ